MPTSEGKIQLFIPGIPQPKGSIRAFMPKGRGFPILTSDNPKAKKWEDEIRRAIRSEEYLTGPIVINLKFCMPIPKSTSKKRRLTLNWQVKKPDIDKLARAILDALTGTIYKDDSQVAKLTAEKIYGDSPGVFIGIDSLV